MSGTETLNLHDLFPAGELPDNVYNAVIKLAAAARDISIEHDLCTVCLVEALFATVDEAVEQGRLSHESATLQ